MEEGHFNFSKFHVLFHYTKCIRMYSAANGFDTAHSKAAHKYLIKSFYARTNRQDNFLSQIQWHNSRKLAILAMEGLLLRGLTQPTSLAEEMLDPGITRPTCAIKLAQLGYTAFTTESSKIRDQGFDWQRWGRASAIACLTGIPDFLDALAVFVRESQIWSDQQLETLANQDIHL